MPRMAVTDQGAPGENRCHRSVDAYPQLPARDPAFGLNLEAFIACSGATTSNITTSGQWGEPAQVEALNETTDVVTLTIGGNDVGFQAFATECLSPFAGECDEFTAIYDDTMEAIDGLVPSIVSTLGVVLAAAPNAEVYLIGYPHIAPQQNFVEENLNCTALFQPLFNAWGNGRASRDVVNSLNLALEVSVDTISIQMNTDRVVFVDTKNGAFYGHDTCSTGGDSYFNGIDYINQEYTAHPNSDGHRALKEDIAEVIG